MEDHRPTLITERLKLRPFHLSDSKVVQKLAGHKKIYATTATIPHPYSDGVAEEWISKHPEWFRNGNSVQFAVVLKKNSELVGCVDLLGISKTHRKAEIGYWIGVDYWNNGYCTEAARELIRFGFTTLKLHKVIGRHFSNNETSGKVLQKIGMKKVGTLRDDFFKEGKFRDIVLYEAIHIF